MTNHLKRIASPRTWIIDRKSRVYITKPSPGPHKQVNGLALGVVLRDVLHIVTTMAEAKKLLNNNEILVDGVRRKDHRFVVGLFDVISLPQTKQAYRMSLDVKGRITVLPCPEKETSIKLCKIVGKTTIPKGKIQYNLHDGKNILSEGKAKVGDSVLVSLPSLEIKQVLPLQANSLVFLTSGKHAGGVGQLKEIKSDEAIYADPAGDVATAKRYLFVVGEKSPVITIKAAQATTTE